MTRTFRLARRGAALALLAAALGGCAKEEARAPEEVAARAQSLIEAGNQAMTQGDYRLAAKRYAAAAVVDKNDPAAYYGMGMALKRLGRDEEARAAYARAKELARSE